MKKFFTLFSISLCMLSCNSDQTKHQKAENGDVFLDNDRNVVATYLADDNMTEPSKRMGNKTPYRSKTTSIDEFVDIRNSANVMNIAKKDSELIVSSYTDKKFFVEQIDKISHSIKKHKAVDKTIHEQLGDLGKKKISVSITEDVPIKDAIMDISNLSGVDVEIDPNIEGTVIMSLKEVTIADVFQRIADLTGMYVSVSHGVVRFKPDVAVTKNYSISFLDNISQGVGNFGAASGVGSSSNALSSYGVSSGNTNTTNTNNANTSASGFPTNSVASSVTTTSVSGSTGSSMWGRFEDGLRYIVQGYQEKYKTGANAANAKPFSYSINQQAGIITLRAPSRLHRDVEEYIEKVKKVATTQILVEVRLVQVNLSDQFASGISFDELNNHGVGIVGSFIPPTAIGGGSFVGSIASKGTGGVGLTAAIQFLKSFGTTKTISSPRLNVMNNQIARLSFAKDHVYFSLTPQLQNQFAAAGAAVSNPTTPIIVQSVVRTVPVGIILDLQATADVETGQITMNVHPILSSITGTVTDPAASFLGSLSQVSSALAASIKNEIPVVEKKELNSTLRIKSGNIMVIGGFNEELTSKKRVGIPILKDIPILRYLFGSDSKQVTNAETVIFIKATIIDADTPMLSDDEDFYEKFA